MSLAGTLIIEAFHYAVNDVELDEVVNGLPTGKKLPRRIFALQGMDSDVIIEIRIDPTDVAAIVAALSKERVIKPTAADLHIVGRGILGT